MKPAAAPLAPSAAPLERLGETRLDGLRAAARYARLAAFAGACAAWVLVRYVLLHRRAPARRG